MGRVRSKTVKKSSSQVIERYCVKFLDKLAMIPWKFLQPPNEAHPEEARVWHLAVEVREKVQEHVESTEIVLNLICANCGKAVSGVNIHAYHREAMVASWS